MIPCDDFFPMLRLYIENTNMENVPADLINPLFIYLRENFEKSGQITLEDFKECNVMEMKPDQLRFYCCYQVNLESFEIELSIAKDGETLKCDETYDRLCDFAINLANMIPHNGSTDIKGSIFLQCFSTELLNFFKQNNIKLTYGKPRYDKLGQYEMDWTEISSDKYIFVDYGNDT